MNPEVARKNNNIRSTPISEYSNARHNNTVFINPKNTSCWLFNFINLIIHKLSYFLKL